MMVEGWNLFKNEPVIMWYHSPRYDLYGTEYYNTVVLPVGKREVDMKIKRYYYEEGKGPVYDVCPCCTEKDAELERIKENAEFYRKMAEQKMDHAAILSFQLAEMKHQQKKLKTVLETIIDSLEDKPE